MPFLPLPPRTVARGGGRGLLVNSIHGVDTLRYVVVLYRLSTSNHNVFLSILSRDTIVLYRLSTSNHNRPVCVHNVRYIVLYRLSTSNHNHGSVLDEVVYIVLYRLSTSNHNSVRLWRTYHQLSYIVFLHQTTTHPLQGHRYINCLISSFYIKPQRIEEKYSLWIYCLISSFYIKPQRAVCISWLRHVLSYIVFLHQTTTSLIYSSDSQSV